MVNFYMLIGLPGSGKTETASQLANDNIVVLSSDVIRKEFYGDERIQDNPAKIFEEMQRRTISALKNGKDVIYDATNISRKKRKHLLASLSIPCKKIAYVIWARYETCVERDLKRTHSVSDKVIRRMLLNFQPPYYDEGWDDIQFKLNDIPYSCADYDNRLECEHDNPHHNNTVKEHTLKVMTETMKLNQARSHGKRISTLITFAASLHDIGKKFVKSFKNSHGEPCDIAHYYNHQNVSSYFATGLESLNTLDLKDKITVIWLVNVHMEPFFKSKYYFTLPNDLKSLVDKLHRCDTEGA